ncbi:MAG TPA: glycosyltransferase [Solirubrobacteraceae bacterium]|nr:glycosyltransferase [Solirubrobacteraceae bacterium]
MLIAARRAGRERVLTAPLTRRVAGLARRMRADAVLVIKGRFLLREDVEALRRNLQVPIAVYYPDDPLFSAYAETEWTDAIPAYDLTVTWSNGPARRLRGAGARRVAVIPFGYDPDLYPARPPGIGFRYDVVFVGQWQAVRQEFLVELAHLNVGIAGSGWAQRVAGTPLERRVIRGRHFGREVANLYHRSRAALNIVNPQNLDNHNMRTWELPATRTAMVATRTPDHERMFGDSKALLVADPTELRRGVEALLADERLREDIATGGREAVVHGTYGARAKEIAACLERL